MYMLLTGNPPFDGETDKEVLRNVRSGKFSLEGAEFENISEEAMDLLKQLLVLDMNKRI
jgi:serine/threonine protein kinase